MVQDFFHQQYCWISETEGKIGGGGVSYMVSKKVFVDERIGGVSCMVSKMFVDVVCCFYSFLMLLIVCASILEAALKLDSCPPTKICKI